MSADAQGGLGHRVVLIRAARRYADKVRFLFLQHLMIVRIGPERVGPGDGLGAASGVGVGDGYDFDVLPPVEDEVVFVTVIPVAGVANDGGAELSSANRERWSRVGGNSGQRSQTERMRQELATGRACGRWV